MEVVLLSVDMLVVHYREWVVDEVVVWEDFLADVEDFQLYEEALEEALFQVPSLHQTLV